MNQGDGWRLEFYRDERGNAPVQGFIDSLEPKMKQKVDRNIDLLQATGNRLGMPLTRPVVGHDFSELRVQTGGNIVRIFYVFFTGRRIVLLHGFTKKDRKTPASELAIAARRLFHFRSKERA